MKIDINEERNLELREVFNPITFRTEDGQKLSICMRDDGFEIMSNGANLYYALDGKIAPVLSGKVEKTKGHVECILAVMSELFPGVDYQAITRHPFHVTVEVKNQDPEIVRKCIINKISDLWEVEVVLWEVEAVKVKEFSEVQEEKVAPTHPGIYIKEDILGELNFDEKQLAERLFISQEELSKIIDGKGQITLEMSHVLAEITGTSVQLWLNLQQHHNAWLHHSDGHPLGEGNCIICQESSDKEDAERWRALLSSGRIRILGSGGLGEKEYQHIGMEIWSKVPKTDNDYGKKVLTKYADTIRESK